MDLIPSFILCRYKSLYMFYFGILRPLIIIIIDNIVERVWFKKL